jgi:hypothetical protein
MTLPLNIKKFRTALIPGAIFIFGTGMFGVIAFISITDGWHFNMRALTIVSCALLIYSFIWSWLIAFFWPVGFSADGIYGHSVWGFRRFISWHDIMKAQTFRLLNLKWLRISGANGKTTWLALFQARDTEFRQEVRQFAPPSNPVLNYL